MLKDLVKKSPKYMYVEILMFGQPSHLNPHFVIYSLVLTEVGHHL